MSTHERTRNVLVIAYYFPPMGLSGVQRTLKFVKYLPKFGWQPTVVTVTPTGYFAEDRSLLEELPRNMDVIRIGSLDPNRLFRRKGVIKLPSEPLRKVFTFLSDMVFIPDNKIGWKRNVLRQIDRILQGKKFHLIFATAPPFTDFLIGKTLHERYDIPLVVDYRDVWHEYPYKYYPTPLHRYLNFRFEQTVLDAASAVVTTNRRVKELLLNRYRFLHYDDVKIIPQGYDPADFVNGSVSRRRAPRRRKKPKFRIAHAGTFYGDRSPAYFLSGVKQAMADHPSIKGNIEIHFVGAFRDVDRKTIAALGLDDVVRIHGYLDHRECIKELVASDVLWLTLGNDRQSPGKVYEYLGARKPILACVPEGFIGQTIVEAGAGLVVKPDDVGAIAKAIIDFFKKQRRGTLARPRKDVVERYNRINLTEELARMFSLLTDGQGDRGFSIHRKK